MKVALVNCHIPHFAFVLVAMRAATYKSGDTLTLLPVLMEQYIFSMGNGSL